MPTAIEAHWQSTLPEKLPLAREAAYLALGCLSLCQFAIAISLKFPSIAEAVALLS